MEQDDSSSLELCEPAELSCALCPSRPRYAYRHELLDHMALHECSKLPYCCSSCHVGFDLERQLETHIGSQEHQQNGKRARSDEPDSHEAEAVYIDDLLPWEQAHVRRGNKEPLVAVPAASPCLVDVDSIMGGLHVQTHHAQRAFEQAMQANLYSAFRSRFETLAEQRKVAQAVQDGISIPPLAQVNAVFETGAGMVESISLGLPGLFLHIVPPSVIYARWLAYGMPIQQPQVEYTSTKERIYSSYVSALHFERLCSRIPLPPHQQLLVTFLYADATVLVKHGTRNAHPIYMVYANAPKTVPKAEQLLLVGYIPGVSRDYMQGQNVSSSKAQATFRANVYQKSIEIVTRLMGVTVHTHSGIHVTPLGQDRPLHIFPILGAFLGDRLELMTAVGMYSSQNASKMQHPCRTCNIRGADLLLKDCPQHPVGRPDDFDTIARCYNVINDRQHGQITAAQEVLKAHSRQAVMPALRMCHMFQLETMTPRCTLHTTKIVMANYWLTWTLQSFLAQDPSANWLECINERAARIDPGLECIYKKIQGSGWSISPQILTGQHRQRALDVLIFAVRGVAVPDYHNDFTVRALARWRNFQVTVTLKRFTETHLRQVDECKKAIKALTHEAFPNQTNFSFPTGHELDHIVLDRQEYGNFTITNTEQGEKGHKTMVKKYWDQTSRQKTERTMVTALEYYVHGHLVRPLRQVEQERTAKAKPMGLVGDAPAVVLGQMVDEYAAVQSAEMSAIPWRRFPDAWAIECSDDMEQLPAARVMHHEIWVHKQYRLPTGEKVKAAPRFHNQEHLTDIVKLADGSFYRVVLIFKAKSTSLNGPGRPQAYMYAERMEWLRHCTIYMLELVRETRAYMIIHPKHITELYASRWVPGCDGESEYYLLGTDMDHNVRAEG